MNFVGAEHKYEKTETLCQEYLSELTVSVHNRKVMTGYSHQRVRDTDEKTERNVRRSCGGRNSHLGSVVGVGHTHGRGTARNA